MRGDSTTFKGRTGVLFFRDIPKTLRDEFKAQCSRRGKSMRTVIIDFLKQYVKEGNKVKGINFVPAGKKKAKK